MAFNPTLPTPPSMKGGVEGHGGAIHILLLNKIEVSISLDKCDSKVLYIYIYIYILNLQPITFR